MRSAGTSPKARRTVTGNDLAWADLVFVMEKRHRQQLRQRFGDLVDKTIVNLDIPDDYRYMDPELVDLLEASVSEALKEHV